MQVNGPNDWVNNKQRLKEAGTSSVEINFDIPIAEIREYYPNARFLIG